MYSFTMYKYYVLVLGKYYVLDFVFFFKENSSWARFFFFSAFEGMRS